MKHLALFESFEITEPIKDGEPLNNREINILLGHNVVCPELILKDDNYYYVFDHRCEYIKDLPVTYIHGLCSKFDIKNYKINDDLSIDVDYVSFYKTSLSKIPLVFNIVRGSFYCYINKLTTLEGSPKYVGGDFNCHSNQLTTLKGSPKIVGGHFDCRFNKLTTLEGSPESVGGYFDCRSNRLTTLEGSPESIGRGIYYSNNKLPT